MKCMLNTRGLDTLTEPEVLINRSSNTGFCVPLLFPEADTSIS